MLLLAYYAAGIISTNLAVVVKKCGYATSYIRQDNGNKFYYIIVKFIPIILFCYHCNQMHLSLSFLHARKFDINTVASTLLINGKV